MSNEFDKARMMANISAMIQMRGIKIGELESKVGVSTGYLSRIGKDDYKAVPTIDVIWKIARELGVNIEWLIEGDPDHGAENILYLQNFIRRVFEKTQSGELEWASHPLIDVADALNGEDVLHIPFIEHDSGKEFTDYSDDLEQCGYIGGSRMAKGCRRVRSHTKPKASVAIADSCFYTDLGTGNYLHLIKFVEVAYLDADEVNPGFPSAREWYELVFEDADEPFMEATPICNTVGRSEALKPDVDKLYQELKQHEFDTRISQDARSIIDSFMNPPQPNVTVYPLFDGDDDQLPF